MTEAASVAACGQDTGRQADVAALGLTSDPYRGQWAAIATMHGKERATAPVLCRWFQMTVTTTPGIDTDALGTFTGEIERSGTMVDAARAKAILAIERTGAHLGIGSEGAFGPHLYIPFVASGQEVLLLHEAKAGHEIIVHHRSETNFAPVILSPSDDPSSFLRGAGFPDHAVIVRPDETNDRSLEKARQAGFLYLSLKHSALSGLSERMSKGIPSWSICWTITDHDSWEMPGLILSSPIRSYPA